MRTRVLTILAVTAAAAAITGCGGSSDSSEATTGGTTTQQATTTATPTIDAKALFVSGKSETGAMACGGCHALKAAGTAGAVGPDLDKIATGDNAAALAEMISDPNAEIVEGYQKDIMPLDYGTKLTAAEIQALAVYIDENSDHAE